MTASRKMRAWPIAAGIAAAGCGSPSPPNEADWVQTSTFDEEEIITAQLTFSDGGELVYVRTLVSYDASGALQEGAVLTYRGSWTQQDDQTFGIELACESVSPGPIPGYGPQSCDDRIAVGLGLSGECSLDEETLTCGAAGAAFTPLSESCSEDC